MKKGLIIEELREEIKGNQRLLDELDQKIGNIDSIEVNDDGTWTKPKRDNADK